MVLHPFLSSRTRAGSSQFFPPEHLAVVMPVERKLGDRASFSPRYNAKHRRGISIRIRCSYLAAATALRWHRGSGGTTWKRNYYGNQLNEDEHVRLYRWQWFLSLAPCLCYLSFLYSSSTPPVIRGPLINVSSFEDPNVFEEQSREVTSAYIYRVLYLMETSFSRIDPES